MQKLLLASSVIAGVSAAQVNPIRRVVTLLQDMQKEIEADGEKEEKLFEKFMCFCKGGTKNMSKAADDASAQISELTAQLEANTAQKAQLTGDLVQHKQDRADAKQDLATATALREKEHNQYVEDSGETKSHIDALSAAIPAIEKGMGSFLQTSAAASLKSLVTAMDSSLDSEDKEAVMSFLEQKGDYIPASGQIVGILKNMKDEMDKSLGGIVADEEAAVKSFTELKAAKEKEIAANSENIEKKTVRAGELAVKISEGKAAIKNATDELDDAQKFKANLKAQCEEKKKDWAERSSTRTEEISAISQAISVLNNDDALDVFNKSNPKALVQNSFLQTGTSKARFITKAKAIVSSINTNGNVAVSLMQHTVLNALKSKKMDFSKVLKMIDDMVVLLKKEQSTDEKTRDWCNAEFDSSADSKKAAENAIADHESAIADLQDEIATLKADIAKAEGNIADLDKSVAESTVQRKEEAADYAEAQGLNDSARKLIFKAKNRLNKFYNPSQHVKKQRRELTDEERIAVANGAVDPRDAEEAANFIPGTQVQAFIQLHEQSGVAPPDSSDVEFDMAKNKSGAGNSVIALMDMLTRDLEKDQQEADHIEKTAQRDYEEDMKEAAQMKRQNAKSIVASNEAKANAEGKLADRKSGLAIESDNLTNTNAYIADLHQKCDFILASFEERRAKRDTEVEGLKNAKAILSGADYQ